MSSDILSFFPYPSPRMGQIKVLKWIEHNWNKYDVMVLQAPVAAGKSVIAYTVANWANHNHGTQTSITTPDNVLVNQYKKDFNLPTLKTADQFISHGYFRQAREDFKNEDIKLMNNFTLLANKVYSEVQIMDEAHELIPMLQDFEGIKIWQHLQYFPDNMHTAADILLWAASLDDDLPLKKKLIKILTKNPTDYTIVYENEPYRGRLRKCLRIYPLTPKNNKPILWPPSKVKKIILMSATIAEPDVVDLGLHNRRVGYIEVPSDIPRENRPFIYSGVASMGRNKTKDAIDKCVHTLGQLEDRYGPRGFVHSTYGLAREIQERYPEKYIYHNAMDKREKLAQWMRNKDDKRTFIGCGLTTGLNLKGDICRWQAILKVQFPDLGDPAVMAKSINMPEWYPWATIKQVIQAYGRVCRSPDDIGATILLDSDFSMVYNKYIHLFPKWFTESFTI